jgi:primosomal protein N' (replication factor Y)
MARFVHLCRVEIKTMFVDVILPLPLPKVFTYRVPELLVPYIQLRIRVIVPFGNQKRYTALVHKIHHQPPAGYQARYIDDVLDMQALLSEAEIQFWEFLASYYMCSLGEVMNAALPAGLKLSSETIFVAAREASEFSNETLSEREFLILEAMEKVKQLSIKDIESIVGIKTVYPIVKAMMERKLIASQEEMREVFARKTIKTIRLTSDFRNDDSLTLLLNTLKRAPKQQELILSFLSIAQQLNQGFTESIVRSKVLDRVGRSAQAALSQLIKKGIFTEEEVVVSRLSGETADENQQINLSEAQKTALNEIHEGFAESRPVLLFGLTGSGKTEIYLELIKEQIEKGKQVLYLLPEIALTAQIIRRLRKAFGRKVQVFHSKFSENERIEVWNAVANADPETGMVVLGARSSIFLPFKNPGLVIVDEEHESSFKQHEPAPRYHGRDAALVLASLTGADILLGSATPSMESFYNARSGKYKLVKLNERFGGATLPEVIINDLRIDTKKRRMKGLFSPLLASEIEKNLKSSNQVILFQNRRGFSPMIECRNCHWIPHCVQCDISLTYHKSIHQLRCHYCGYSTDVPAVCRECSSTDLSMKGFGTEKIEEELSELFPDVSSARMDLDTTRSKQSYHRIIDDFEQQRTEVLIGTQMVSKGLDFDNVRLVGILSADAMLNYPDFRAFERSYQLISQVAGRAGRRQTAGTVIVQTWKPEHEVLKRVVDHDYEGFYQFELEQRERYGYPPFTRIIHITVKHEKQEELDPAADLMAHWLRGVFGNRLLGPEYPPVGRLRNMFQKRLMLKMEQQASPAKVKAALRDALDRFFQEYPLKNFRVIIDVDPV